jgi:hypothetical protein
MGNTITVVATDGFYTSIGQYKVKSKLLARNKSDGDSNGLLNLLPGNGSLLEGINPMETIKEKIAKIKDKLPHMEESK